MTVPLSDARLTEQACEQCGRTGTRGFRTIHPLIPGVKPITICAATKACQRRWPKHPKDDD